jgi:small GTP-binding protein
MSSANRVLPRKFDYSLKIVVVGDSGVGKSCFLIRYVRDTFDEDSQPTLGVEFLTKVVQAGNQRVQLQLWDTAGQELFRSVTTGYYRGSAGAVVMFDLTSQDSFDNVDRWLQDVRDVARSDVVALLVGNKSDLDNRNVTTQEAESYAKAHSMQYFETSAKSGTNVSKAIEAVVATIQKNVDAGVYKIAGNGEQPPPAQDDGSECKC